MNTPTTKQAKGFRMMDPQRVKEIASMGGRAAHYKGTAHEFTSEEAREAGRRGGRAKGINHAARLAAAEVKA